MKKIKILNLDELYNLILEKVQTLDVHGYDAEHEGIDFGSNDSLLFWFMANIHKLKQGCQSILVAEATYSANYVAEGDKIFISSKDVGFGLLILIETFYNNYVYGEDISVNIEKECFLLDIE